MAAEFPATERIEHECPAGRIVIALDADAMRAALSLHPDPEAARVFDMEDILSALEAARVTRGTDQRVLGKLLHEARQGRPPGELVVVARGQSGTAGRDAYLTYPPFERYANNERLPKEAIELTQSQIVNVNVGETVAIYHALEDGSPGCNVRGEYLAVEPGIDVTPRAGRNLRRDGERIIATIDGRLVVQERILQVEENVRIDGDLTVLYGDIDFVGNILVYGNIESGLTIHGHRDITVHGSVFGSTIICDRNLTVKNGIVGGEDAYVEVHGDFEASFVENLQLSVWGDCIIQKSLVNTHLYCGRQVTMPGRGHLVSGEVHARDGIEVAQVGVPVGTKAKLAVGIDALANRRILDIERELGAAEARIKRIRELDEEVGPMTRAYQALAPQKRQEIEKLLAALPALETEVASLRTEHARLTQQSKKNHEARISVRGQVHEDAVIQFPLGRLVVRPASRRLTYAFDLEEMRVVSLPAAA